MINARVFDTFEEMQASPWLQSVYRQFSADLWPIECIRCQQSESIGQESIRLFSLKLHDTLSEKRPDYLIVGGVLDNICNSACQSCNAGLSTKIGYLQNQKNFELIDNKSLFDQLPQDRIIQIDLNGGEPTASPGYQRVLNNLPESVTDVRLNTNASRLLPNIENLLDRGINLTVTISLDGIDKIHDYVRWPITWKTFTQTVNQYKSYATRFENLSLNFWTTVHCFNLDNLENIIEYASDTGIVWAFGLLNLPKELNIAHQNKFTLAAKKKLSLSTNKICSKLCDITATELNNDRELSQYIEQQDNLRSITIKDFVKI